ncbi:hypothetical protein N431DRAFT_533657, partial [Stipitochalara longipes BDJ]
NFSKISNSISLTADLEQQPPSHSYKSRAEGPLFLTFLATTVLCKSGTFQIHFNTPLLTNPTISIPAQEIILNQEQTIYQHTTSNQAKMSSAPAYEDIPLGNMAHGQPGVPRGYPNHAGDSGPRGIDFFKPKDSFKVYNRVLLGVAVLLMAGMISLSVALGVERAHYNQLKAMLPAGSDPSLGGTPIACPTQTSYPATPLTGITGLDLWNSTDCTTPNGNCTALLDIPQVSECFQLNWGMCHANYNSTHPFPKKNDPIFVNNPQCNHLIFQMYCEWESDINSTVPCPAMKNFCVDEFILPGTMTKVELTTVGTIPTLAPVKTMLVTDAFLNSAIPTPAPTTKAAARPTSGSGYD